MKKAQKKTTKKAVKKVSKETLITVTKCTKGMSFKLNVNHDDLQYIVGELILILAGGKPSC